MFFFNEILLFWNFQEAVVKAFAQFPNEILIYFDEHLMLLEVAWLFSLPYRGALRRPLAPDAGLWQPSGGPHRKPLQLTGWAGLHEMARWLRCSLLAAGFGLVLVAGLCLVLAAGSKVRLLEAFGLI